ncbi:MAG: hypothetical protein K2N75_08265 [Helicobacter sp.]|uniref:P-loop NTPase fold protein n=1 Tax=Helicobacter sp. TaxID=218 RepID=UPI0023BCB7BC|nr:P-loop NTPase fold protein [Helicobacter sp.]MDE7176014.1 hypothetical protein [Helicobacter sp.]
MPNENGRISAITEFLIDNESVCLVIQGAWGIGKTYLWKKGIEEDIKKKKKDKRVVYIDLFGKKSYKQILEEIVLKVNGSHNEVVKKVSQLASNTIKLTGVANVNLDSIFSIFKKEDFENIIVCFDNIERKSDKLPLDEILGLVILLKEDKLCSVVMILNKDELEKQESSSGKTENPKNWYEIYKEKVIDYEITIENNDEVARKIIEENLKWDIKDMKQDIVNLIFECFKQKLKFSDNHNNLRLLIKLTRHIDYFNQHCFFKAQIEKPKEVFFEVLKLYYERMVSDIGEHYFLIPKDNLPKSPVGFHFYEIFLNNLLKLDENYKNSAQRFFLKELDKESVTSLKEIQESYINGNLSDNQYAEWIENIFKNTEKSFLVDDLTKNYHRYQILFKLYKNIREKELPQEYEIKKQYIISHTEKDNGLLNNILNTIINEDERYKQIYDECRNQDKTATMDIRSFISRFDLKGEVGFGQGIETTFSLEKIKEYNKFPLDEIVNVFQNNNEFCKRFFEYFGGNFSDDSINKEYDLKNHLFQAYKKFLNQEEYKVKKEEVKKALEKNCPNSLILKLLNEE